MKGKQFKVTVGDILSSDTERYRVLKLDDKISAIKMDTEKMLFVSFDRAEIVKKVSKGEWKIEKSTVSFVLDPDMLSDTALYKYNKYKNACESMVRYLNEEGYQSFSYNRDHSIVSFAKQFDIPKNNLRRAFRLYLQSGFDNSVLIDQRYISKNSRVIMVDGKLKKNPADKQLLSEEDRKNFAKYAQMYISNKYLTMVNAYTNMLNECYREMIVHDGVMEFKQIREEHPTLRQFRYYIMTHYTEEERDQKTMKPHEQRNNKRILKGSSSTGVRYPGEVVEIDECDFPVSLVSKYDPTQTVGRPNVYIMIDVLTHVILAVGISFNQNSYVGLSNMFINMADDKVEYCKKYGVIIQEDEWPSNIIPAQIRCDQGADFKGEDILKVCQKIGIERDLVSVATGSMKGEIENLFHLLQSNLRGLFESKGLITKDWGSKHHKEATINIEAFTQILLLQIIEHNKKSMAQFPMTDQMIADGVLPRPYILWNYFSEKVQSPKPIINRNEYLMALMKEGRASVDRKGIHYLERTYFPEREELPELWNQMYENQNRKTYIDIYYDPRCMNTIYYLANNKLLGMNMSSDKKENKGFFDLSEQEIERINLDIRKLRRKEQKYNENLRADTALLMAKSLEANESKYQPTNKNMITERHIEKSKIAQEVYDIQSRIYETETTSKISERIQAYIDSPTAEEDICDTPNIQKEKTDINEYTSDDQMLERFLALQKKDNKL